MHLPVSHVSERIRKLMIAPRRIHAGELPEILRQHRSGDRRATRRLIRGFEFLLWKQYRYLAHHRNAWLQDRADEILGQLYLDLCDAVRWLKQNDVPASGIKGHIWGNLMQSHRHDYRQTKTDHKTPGDNLMEPALRELGMTEYRSERQRHNMLDDELAEPASDRNAGIVEALRSISDGTKKLADCIELRGLRHDIIKKRALRVRRA